MFFTKNDNLEFCCTRISLKNITISSKSTHSVTKQYGITPNLACELSHAFPAVTAQNKRACSRKLYLTKYFLINEKSF